MLEENMVYSIIHLYVWRILLPIVLNYPLKGFNSLYLPSTRILLLVTYRAKYTAVPGSAGLRPATSSRTPE